MVHVNIRKYFRFVVAGIVYQFRVLPFGLSTAPREFTKTLAPVIQLLRSQGIQVHAYLDDWIIRATSREQSLEHTQHIIQLLQSLGWTINWDKSMLQPSRILDFPGFTFQLRTSPHISYGLVLTNSHRGPIPSISVDGHVCSESFIHHQPDVTFCPIHIQRPSSSTVSPVLVKKTVDSTSAVVGHSNPVGCGLPLLPALVSTANSDDQCSVTSSGPQSVLLYGCISQRLGSQLERPLDFRTMVTSRLSTSYQLVGIRSNPTCTTSMGSSVETSDCESLLRQQYSSSIHPQTGGNKFSAPILQNSGTVRAPGSVCDNSHTYTPPRSQERHSRCSVPSQSTQSNRMASSKRNLEQSVLCLQNSPDRHVRHSGE